VFGKIEETISIHSNMSG